MRAGGSVLSGAAPLLWSGRCRARKRPRPLAPMPQIQLDATLFATAFVTVLVIRDPLGNVPIFLSRVRSGVS